MERKCGKLTVLVDWKCIKYPKASLERGSAAARCVRVTTSVLTVVRGSSDQLNFQMMSRFSIPNVDTRPFNTPEWMDPAQSYADDKFDALQQYTEHVSATLREVHNAAERREFMQAAHDKLSPFVDAHVRDLKRLLLATDTTLASMVLLKMNKKMDTSEAKIRATHAHIPFGVYSSPEFKCLGTSYFVASAHNEGDVQMILSSERRPSCYTFRGAFQFGGFYHRHSEMSYVGPHSEQFQANDPSQGLFCKTDDAWTDTQCIYKVNPREEFPESVSYEPKVSYWCGGRRYYIPTTTDVRCVFSTVAMNFVLRFAYEGVTYKASDLSFIYPNGQQFYTDEPWAGMSCSNFVCKWRHNQNQRTNEFFNN